MRNDLVDASACSYAAENLQGFRPGWARENLAPGSAAAAQAVRRSRRAAPQAAARWHLHGRRVFSRPESMASWRAYVEAAIRHLPAGPAPFALVLTGVALRGDAASCECLGGQLLNEHVPVRESGWTDTKEDFVSPSSAGRVERSRSSQKARSRLIGCVHGILCSLLPAPAACAAH